MDACFVTDDTLRQLDWPWICARLREHIVTPEARDTPLETAWARDPQEAERRLREVHEVMHLLSEGVAFPLGSLPDISPHLVRLKKGAVLEPNELLEIVAVLESSRTLRRFLLVHKDSIPLLASHVEGTPDLGGLISSMRQCVTPDGVLSDTASPLLMELRQQARRLHSQIIKKMSSYLTSEAYRDLLQDTYYTVKEDRYVLPIKAYQRAAIDGIVLGGSASGATLFVEPAEVIALNNAHKLALLEIQKEEQRIFKELSDQLRRYASGLEASARLVTTVDLVHAKARFSMLLNATVPAFTTEPRIRLIQARHPMLVLLTGQVVPNDIHIGPGFTTLILTGPNTGGKTVLLKTVGLCALMARAGLPIPAEQGSSLPFFDRVFVDIGDDQSIEASQSTFSAHISRIKQILESLQGRTLILLDEVIIGTDPEEGAALAQALLEYLAAQGALTVATTHYLDLKTIAAIHPLFQNASMGFDPDTLAPSYRLIMGVPGNSNALEIARRLGFPEEILRTAYSLLGSPRAELDELLTRINQLKQELEADRATLAALIKENKTLQETLAGKWTEVASREKAVKTTFRRKLEQEFSKARQELEQWRRTLKETSSLKASQELRDTLSAISHKVLEEEGMFSDVAWEADRTERRIDWSNIHCGDRVYLRPYNTEARILKMPDPKGRVLVEVGDMRILLKADDIVPLPGTHITIRSSSSKKPLSGYTIREAPGSEDSARHTITCDLRGMIVDEALAEVARSLDMAFRRGVARVRIVHGLGTGALRKAVRGYLQQSPYSVSFRPGQPGEGGDGVTIVDFEQSSFT